VRLQLRRRLPLLAERELIHELLSRGLPLLNVEAQRTGGQLSLL
jgi:hypothetical protein